VDGRVKPGQGDEEKASRMIDEIGHFALVLALCIAAVQIVV
jgi:hypothetical protein